MFDQVQNFQNSNKNQIIRNQSLRMMMFQDLNPQSEQKLLKSLNNYTEDILLQNISKLSYQLAYDNVYQLCRNQKQQKVLQTLSTSLHLVLPKVFSGIKLDSQTFLADLASLITKTQKNVETIKDVCLYLDLNYCQKDMNLYLIDKLNQIFLEQFFKQEKLLQTMGNIIAQQHLNNNEINIKYVFEALRKIDKEDEYFCNNFLRHYLPTFLKHYQAQSSQKYVQANQSKHIQLYIQYAYQNLVKQRDFLTRFFQDPKKCGPNRSFILKELYNILVTKFKQQIYTNHKEKIFNELTLQILELFKFGQKSGDIAKHADWYNLQIKEKLQTFSSEINHLFINHICDFYKNIMTLLQKTHNKFDIHYRSRFAFEEWINSEKLHMPLRLNQYIKDFCLGTNAENQKQQSILEKIAIIFVLMKDKKIFEKNYRRELIQRILDNIEGYDLCIEEKIIQLMQKQCSEEFVKYIKPILTSYRNHEFSLGKEHPHIRTFLLNIENWPYDQKNASIALNQQLVALAEKSTAFFSETQKDKTLYWHPIIGVVRLEMKFLNSKWNGQLIVNTCMANLLLHFLKTQYQPYELKVFCCWTGFKLDELYDSVRKLLHTKVLLNEGNQENYKLALNENFTNDTQVFNVLNIEIVNKFEVKPLEELKADRKFMVEAIIVKIMKRLKNTDKQTLMKEAAPLIEKRGFSFNSKFVEQTIQRLVDKEFIRDYEDGKFGYIA